jgi:hypothetical protein
MVLYGCHISMSHIVWFNTTETYSHTLLKDSSLKSRCKQDHATSENLNRIVLYLFLTSRVVVRIFRVIVVRLYHSNLCLSSPVTISVSLCIFIWLSFLYLLFLQGHQWYYMKTHLTHFKLIPFALQIQLWFRWGLSPKVP